MNTKNQHANVGRPLGAKDRQPRRVPKCVLVMEQAGYVSLETASELVGVHLSTIFRLARDGDIPSTTVGKYRFIHRQHLADFYEAPPIRERILAYTPRTEGEVIVED